MTARITFIAWAVAAGLCWSATASAQTPTGHEIAVGLTHYNYTEPGDQSISIHGAKLRADYTGTISLSRGRRWFAQVHAAGVFGNVAYDGWCSEFLLTPNSSSPNGFLLDLGDASPCSESGDSDWYVEGHAVIGKDFVDGEGWGWSPYAGLGVRHLSNGTSGIKGYRTDNYLFLPLGATVHVARASRHALSVNLEYDRLLRGWQKTRDSQFGGGDVPATATAPAFTIDGFTDTAFDQHGGWAFRASAAYHLTARWSIVPYYIHWRVESSPADAETVTFTVNHVTAREQLGFYEPLNTTNEFGVKLALHLH
jgi:hypothetical protein